MSVEIPIFVDRYDLYPQICTVDCYEVYPDDTFPVLRSTTTILFPYSLTITITTPSSLLSSSPSSRKTTRSYGIGKKSNVNFWEGLPDNAFQKCKQGTSYSLLQRGGSLVKASPKLFAIGFSSMTVGSLFIDFLGLFRIPWTVQAFSEAFTSSPSNFENVLVNALATGVYVAVSTNFRLYHSQLIPHSNCTALSPTLTLTTFIPSPLILTLPHLFFSPSQ